jgi:hypothetical protein
MRKWPVICGVLCGLLLLVSCRSETPIVEPNTKAARRAVLIGIDDYSASKIPPRRGLSPVTDRSWVPLRGAVRDVDQLRELLVLHYGFHPDAILVLRNQEATRDAIIAAIEKHLYEPAKKDDVLLFFFAGHGSQVENTLSSELDQLDESIVPADSKLGVPDIRDKELAEHFNRILDRNARLTIVFDSCHSGSGTRALMSDSDARSVAVDTRDVRDSSEPPAPESRGALVLAASKDFGRAFETIAEDGKYHGVFSWALLRAMRDARSDESAMDMFLRAQAMIRADSPYQDPVIGGTPGVQSTPFLSAGGAVQRRTTVAVEKVSTDGTVILHGGWAHGLTAGTVLRPRNDSNPNARIRIKELIGIGRSVGVFVSAPAKADRRPRLTPGTLLETVEWAAVQGRPFRVWMPVTSDPNAAHAFAQRVRREARTANVTWVDDPTAQAPTHILRWRDDSWELVPPTGKRRRVNTASFVHELPPRASLFVQLPVPSALSKAIGVGPGTDYSNVEPRTDPRDADYVLAGRLSGNAVEYAWIRPEVRQEDAAHTPLPPRSDWYPPVPAPGIALRQNILRLNTIQMWHRLVSPIEAPSPYRLAIIDSEENRDVQNDAVVEGRRYNLRLLAIDPKAKHIEPRYYYVFAIDHFGRGILLFPLRGSVENQFPIADDGAPPARPIDVGAFRPMRPLGVDTYFLLSTDESLPNPAILQSPGVRTRGPRGGTPLEELLSRTGGSARSPEPIQTSPVWSIDRFQLKSVANKP